MIVSPETFELVARAVDGWRVTGGRFDPTVLASMVSHGYDRTFDQIGDVRRAPSEAQIPAGCEGIELIPELSSVRLPDGVGFDPGGIGKGFAADLVCEELIAYGAAGACVNIGGDLRVIGAAPDAGGWRIDIEHPFRDEPVAAIDVREGAVVTTTKVRRAWKLNGSYVHHLIDPATGEPADTGLASVSIVAGEAWWAEIWSKAAFVAGAARADAALAEAEVVAFLVDDRGNVRVVERLDRAG